MKLLKRLWKATGTQTAFYTVMALSLAVQGWNWHVLSQEYDLDQITSSPDYALIYRIVFLELMGVATVGLTLGSIASTVVRRFLPRPLLVDRSYPPVEMVYLQGDGEPERCACHDKPIEDGALIYHWPQPAKLVCKGGTR